MTFKKYELFEHTADVGLRIFGQDTKELFINAAQGMYSIIAKALISKQKTQRPRQIFKINASAQNLEELLVCWLSELLSLTDIHNIIFNDYRIQRLTNTSIIAEVGAEDFSKDNFQTQTEIKAVTYHGLKIEKHKGFWQAEIVFDV